MDASPELQSVLVDAMLSLPPVRPEPKARAEALATWVHKAGLLSKLVEVQLLQGEPVSNLHSVLLDDLRRCLQDFSAQEMQHVTCRSS